MKKSSIEWTEATWNPTIGCDKVSSGCKFCYAETMAKRLQAMGTPGYEDGFKFKMLPSRLRQPLDIKKPTIFFVNSMSDLFHEACDFTFIDKVFETIRATPYHTYQILTKREDILYEYFKTRNSSHNAWLGVSVESSTFAHRVDTLSSIQGINRFLSIEPLIGDVGKLNLENIHWVIVGGESGVKARPMKMDWILNIKDQCRDYGVPFFFKQWGAYNKNGVKKSKKANGRRLEGKLYDEMPVF